MAFKLADSIKEVSTTPVGTGASTVSGTPPSGGNKSFASYLTVGDTTWLTRRAGDDFETGLFTYTAANVLTPTSIYESSNANAPVVWGAGVKTLMCDLPASRVGTMVSKNLSDTFSFTDATDATDVTHGGAFTVAGGMAVAKKLFVGGAASIAGALSVTGNSLFSGALSFTDGVAVVRGLVNAAVGYFGTSTNHPLFLQTNGANRGSISASGDWNISSTTPSTSSTTGALTVAGGIGVAGAVAAGGGFRTGGLANIPALSNSPQTTLYVPTSTSAVLWTGSYAILFVTDIAITGATAVFILAGGTTQLIATSGGGTFVEGLAPATNKIAVGYSGGNFVVINNHPGGTVGIRTQIFQML